MKGKIRYIQAALLCVLFLLAAGLLSGPAARVEEPVQEIHPPREETPTWAPAPVTVPVPLLDVVDVVIETAGVSAAPETASVPIAPQDEARLYFRPDVPMPVEHQAALYDACEDSGVEIPVALGLVELESSFQADAVSETECYGYCQLSRYFQKGLSPEENLRAGIGWLGVLIEQHGDVATALTVYHLGSDDGTRDYANVVLRYATKWEAIA